MTVVLHVVSAVTTALHHATAVATVAMTAVLHARGARVVSPQARVALKAANRMTARVTASASLHTREISNHCVVARETRNDMSLIE